MAKPWGIALFGPTGSGKSALALELAERLGGEVINADSRQVYRRVQVVTAGPTAEERARVRHHLFDFLPLEEVYSAGRWVADVQRVLVGVVERGKVPIVVGGTGFYLKALLDGLGGVPEIGWAVLEKVAALPLVEVWAELERIDPVLAARMAARGEQGNRQRVVRAVAVFRATGEPLSVWQAKPGQPLADILWRRVALNPPVEVLEARLAARWEALLGQGLLDEIVALEGVPDTAPGMQSLTVGVWRALVRGDISREEAVWQATLKDRQYAKRQRTWLRTQFGAEAVFASGEEALRALMESR